MKTWKNLCWSRSLPHFIFLLFLNSAWADIEFVPRKIELPKNLYIGQVITNTVKIRNVSSKPILVHGVNADCGCTFAELPSGLLPAGQERSFLVVFDTKDKHGFQEVAVTVATDLGPRTIFVVGKVSQPLRVFPLAMHIAAMPGPLLKTNVILRFQKNYHVPGLPDLELVSNTTNLITSIRKHPDEKEAYVIDFKMDTLKAMENPFPNMIVDIKDRRTGVREQVSISLELKLPFKNSPEFLNLGLIAPTNQASACITISGDMAPSIRLIKTRASHAWFSPKLVDGPKNQWQLCLQVNTTIPPPDDKQAYVEVETDSPQLPRWRVPVVYALMDIKKNGCCGDLETK